MVISIGQEVLITTSTARRSANCLRTHVKYVRAAQRMVGGLPHNKKMSGTSGKIISMK